MVRTALVRTLPTQDEPRSSGSSSVHSVIRNLIKLTASCTSVSLGQSWLGLFLSWDLILLRLFYIGANLPTDLVRDDTHTLPTQDEPRSKRQSLVDPAICI
jgi:hypothetical protein